MHTRHRFRMASVSKPITSLEIMHLAERGRLSLDDHVFGPGSLLGDSYRPATGYADSRVLDITVRELLEHTGGGWDNDGADGSDDPMFTQPTLGAGRAHHERARRARRSSSRRARRTSTRTSATACSAASSSA